MILPAKHLRQDRALLSVGAEILTALQGEGRTVSELWERCRTARSVSSAPLSFDWFVLALCFLHAIRSIELEAGVVTRHLDRT